MLSSGTRTLENRSHSPGSDNPDLGNESQRGGGEPGYQSRQGFWSHTGEWYQHKQCAFTRPTDDWNLKHTALDDEGKRLQENWVTETVNAVVTDEQGRTGSQGLRRPDSPRPNDEHLLYRPGPTPLQGQNTTQPMKWRYGDHSAKGEGLSPGVMSFRCLGKDHNASNPICPMLERGGEPVRRPWNQPQLKVVQVSEEGGGTDALGDPSKEVSGADEFDGVAQWEPAMTGGGSLCINHEDASWVESETIKGVCRNTEESFTIFFYKTPKNVI